MLLVLWQRGQIRHSKTPIVSKPNINSFSKYFNPGIFESDNKWFCSSCNCLTESTRETLITSSGSVLLIQLSRFSTSHSKLIKDQQVFNCSCYVELKVPINAEDEVSFSTTYCLMASICHSGRLDQGHYWAIVKMFKFRRLAVFYWQSCANSTTTFPK